MQNLKIITHTKNKLNKLPFLISKNRKATNTIVNTTLATTCEEVLLIRPLHTSGIVSATPAAPKTMFP